MRLNVAASRGGALTFTWKAQLAVCCFASVAVQVIGVAPTG